jgi:hypothetical protein
MRSFPFFKDLILRSTQRLTEMSGPTRDIYRELKAAGAGAETFLWPLSRYPANLNLLKT